MLTRFPVDFDGGAATLHEAFCKPEAFDSNLAESPPPKTNFDDDDGSYAFGRQRHGDQAVGMKSGFEADVYSDSTAECHVDDDDHWSHTVSTDENYSPPSCRTLEESVSDAAPYSVQLSRDHATVPSEHAITLDFPDDCAALPVSTADRTPMAQEKAEQQKPEIAGSFTVTESDAECIQAAKDIGEKYAVFDQGDRLECRRRETELAEESAQQNFDPQPVEFDSGKITYAVCVSGEFPVSVKVGESFPVYVEELTPPEFEAQPVDLHVLRDLATTPIVDDVPEQTAKRTDLNATFAVFCVDPCVCELSLETSAYALDILETGVARMEVCDRGHFVEAAVALPETECAVQELTDDADFVVCLPSPEAATLCELYEFLPTLFLARSDKTEAKTSTGQEGSRPITGSEFLLKSKLAAAEDAKEKPDDAKQSDAICLPLTAETVGQPTAETYTETEQSMGAVSVNQSAVNLSGIQKYGDDDHEAGSFDQHRLETEFSDSYSQECGVGRLTKEDLETRTPSDFSEMKSEALKGGDGRPCADHMETVTSDDWRVVVKETDDKKLMEEVSRTLEQLSADTEEVPRQAGQQVYDSSRDEISDQYHVATTSRTFCTVHTWGVNDVILSTIVNAILLEVYDVAAV